MPAVLKRYIGELVLEALLSYYYIFPFGPYM